MGGRRPKRQKRELSQAEIWDDSALVRSWNDALAEYKKYHSIQAQDKKVTDVIEDFNGNLEGEVKTGKILEVDQDLAPLDRSKCDDQEILEDGELKEDETEVMVKESITDAIQPSDHDQQFQSTENGQPSINPSVPIAITGRIQDETLKNLMVSWYYAGYYAGIYERQISLGSRSKE